MTVIEYEKVLGRLKAEVSVLQQERMTLEESLAYWQAVAANGNRAAKPKATNAKTPKRKRVSVSSIQGCGGPFAKGCANMVAGGVEKCYLENTGKTNVPAQDPAFGRRA